jgi:hypothetical protein
MALWKTMMSGLEKQEDAKCDAGKEAGPNRLSSIGRIRVADVSWWRKQRSQSAGGRTIATINA